MTDIGIQRIRVVLLRAADIWTLGRWYEDVLGLTPMPPPPGDTHFWPPLFKLGDTILELGTGGSVKTVPENRADVPLVTVFEVADIHATAAALAERGVPLVKDVFEVGGGRSFMLYIADPEGNLLGFQQVRR